MSDDISALLKVHDYFRGVSDEAVRDVLGAARVRHVGAGEVVHQADDPIVSVGFILRGRLKAVKVDAQGRETLFRIMERGDQYGMMLGALQETVPVRVISLEPSTILLIDYEQAMELTLRHADLRRLWLKTYAGSLRKHFFGAAPRRGPTMLGLIHETPASRPTAERLIARLREIGENLAVLSDSGQWRGLPDVRYRSLIENGVPLSAEEARRQVAEWQDAHRIILDIDIRSPIETVERMMRLVDRAIYFVPTAAGEAALDHLRKLDVGARGWRDKLAVAWLVEEGQSTAPTTPGLNELVSRDFKLSDTPSQSPWGRVLGNGLERLVHDLRGVRIGVALGGGAARGMSHLGVLKALEQNGIVVDMIAGTSAGAMTGIVYASGLDADYSASQFSNDLRPSWIFRCFPSGKHWYLLYKYRRGHFDAMLRKYLHDWRLEQLPLPCLSVTVDLVGGNSVVRERGDATHAVLESINLPVLSVPIVREGQALIDGGLVNNIPADVLVAQGCNFVIAVSVTAKMEHEFCAIRPDSPAPRKKPSAVQTLLRSLLVQNHSLNAFGVQPADVVIAPDVRGFDLTEFTRAEELAAIGKAAAREEIPRIQQLLARLDPQLFRSFGAAKTA
jgi:predicted acylesterase/phospholipase RssA/CRP-like cAMP-binding protein